jgi:hypothetical protein
MKQSHTLALRANPSPADSSHFLSLATYLPIATIAIVAQQDSLVFLGYRDAMV